MEMKQDPVVERRSRMLHRLDKANFLTAKYPLLLEVMLRPGDAWYIGQAVSQYLLASMNWRDNLIFSEKALDPSMALGPLWNRTPNGALAPKAEIAMEYNIVLKAVVRAFKKLDILHNFSHATVPNVRFVYGEMNKAEEARPYSSTKLHSELWVGQSFDVLVHIPVSGDVRNTWCCFSEPLKIKKGFARKLTDYSEGNKFFEGPRDYPLIPKIGFAYLADVHSLHRTIKGGGNRISIEFGLVYEGKSEFPKASYAQPYVDLSEWIRLGTGVYLTNYEGYFDCVGKV